jgi:hypothetical protein
MSFSSLVVRFQSAAMIPPPYTHYYTLTARPQGQQLRIEFSITYTDREELDEEDITGEGFTLSDDFEWSGTLGKAWLPIIEKLLKSTRLKPFDEAKLGEEADYLEVTITPNGGTAQVGTPTDAEAFLYTIQELIQASYEAGGKERPFELIYLNYNPNSDLELRINASFAERTVQRLLRRNRQDSVQTLSWERLKEAMAVVYAHDYHPDDSLSKPPKQDGQYLCPTGQEWYDITSLTDVQRTLEEL